MNTRPIASSIVVAVILSGCFQREIDVEESDLGLFEITDTSSRRSIILRPREDIDVDEVFDPDLFGDFWPKITHEEATERFGEPLLVRRTSYGVFYYYRTPAGVVEVAHEEVRSWGVAMKWKLRAYPTSEDASTLLHPGIARHIEGSTKFLSVTIMNPNGTPGKEVVAKNGKVLYALWTNPA